MIRSLVVGCLVAGTLGGVAVAQAEATTPTAIPRIRIEEFPRDPAPELAPAAPGEALLPNQTIFLNRCVGGCTVTPGTDNAVVSTSPAATSPVMLAEFAWRPNEWEQIVQCVKEVYSPFHVTITDQRPAAAPYSAIMVAGAASDFGKDPNIGGFVGALSCTPFDKALAFAFPALIDSFAQSTGSRVTAMCWIIAQETAHDFTLDHENHFADADMDPDNNRSACNDPMTYQTDCGGEKFFRNKPAQCGEFTNTRQCRCTGDSQNSHQVLLSVLGEGASTIPPPTVSVAVPAENAPVLAVIAASAGSKRGIEKVELVINGTVWGTQPGAEFARTGQPNPSTYTFPTPPTLPDGIVDIVFRAYDDLGAMTESAPVTAYKGDPAGCVTDSTCLKGQDCENGRCFFPPATGELGDDCEADQNCLSGQCGGTATSTICTQDCRTTNPLACPMDLVCTVPKNAEDPKAGICFTKPEAAGCCSASNEGLPWAQGLGLLVLGALLLPRRRQN